ncbi:MAG: bifunctional metallophosphatase/5'-nucleotidase [Ginsengibacter sp.]
MELSIAYINDVHGYLEPHPELFYKDGEDFIETAGGYARIASKVKDARSRNKHFLLFDGGDTFHGTLPVVKSRGECLVPILNEMGFSAMVGHWDFAYGPEQLLNLANQLNYPVLGMNVYKEDGELFLPPFIIETIGSLKVAVLGICCNIIDKTMPAHFSKGIKLTDGSEELPRYIEKVKSEGADIVILLSHNGFPQDVSLLKKIKGVDVCLSAHTHNRLYEAVEVGETIVIQCGCHGSFIGNLKLQVEEKKIKSFSYQLEPVDSKIQADSVIEKMVGEIMEPYRDIEKDEKGKTAAILHRYSTLASTMDDFLLAAIKDAADAEIAFSNGWRYGAPIPEGLITTWDLYNTVPMNPIISTVEITGEEIKQLLEDNLEKTFSDDAMKQMGGYVKRCAGLYVKMRVENPSGHRIQEIYCNGIHLQKDRIYKAAFVTVQAVPKKFGKNRQDLDIRAVEAMQNYLKKNPGYQPGNLNSFCLV